MCLLDWCNFPFQLAQIDATVGDHENVQMAHLFAEDHCQILSGGDLRSVVFAYYSFLHKDERGEKKSADSTTHR
jgi:hypothetical protein